MFSGYYQPSQSDCFEDTYLVPELLNSPFVSGEGGIRFYTGAPLVSHDGFHLGTVCVVSDKPSKIKEGEEEILTDLASLVMEHMEMRMIARKAVRKHDELHSGVFVGIDTPLKQQLELLNKAKKVPRPVHIITRTENIAKDVLAITASLLFESGNEKKIILPQPESVSIAAIASEVAKDFEATVAAKNQELYFTVASRRELHVDPSLMQEAITLLVEHLIKYTQLGGSIAIDFFEAEGTFKVEVSNEDTTLKEPDLVKMFYKYASLDGKVTGNENSTGLELARAKDIIESHDGKVWAEAAHHGLATKIVVEFQID